MSKEAASPTVKKLRTGARLSDAQEEAVKRLARRLSRERGTQIHKADIYREALAALCRTRGEEWPE